MIRGFFLAAVLLPLISPLPAAEPEKAQFKQSANPPRELAEKKGSGASAQSQDMIAFESYRETLKAWHSARKRLHALEAVNKVLQNDPASDKEIVAMIELMAIEKKQEVENLRTQLAGILDSGRLEDPKLPQVDRDAILIRVK